MSSSVSLGYQSPNKCPDVLSIGSSFVLPQTVHVYVLIPSSKWLGSFVILPSSYVHSSVSVSPQLHNLSCLSSSVSLGYQSPNKCPAVFSIDSSFVLPQTVHV